jgi:hypothetical protein
MRPPQSLHLPQQPSQIASPNRGLPITPMHTDRQELVGIMQRLSATGDWNRYAVHTIFCFS